MPGGAGLRPARGVGGTSTRQRAGRQRYFASTEVAKSRRNIDPRRVMSGENPTQQTYKGGDPEHKQKSWPGDSEQPSQRSSGNQPFHTQIKL